MASLYQKNISILEELTMPAPAVETWFVDSSVVSPINITINNVNIPVIKTKGLELVNNDIVEVKRFYKLNQTVQEPLTNPENISIFKEPIIPSPNIATWFVNITNNIVSIPVIRTIEKEPDATNAPLELGHNVIVETKRFFKENQTGPGPVTNPDEISRHLIYLNVGLFLIAGVLGLVFNLGIVLATFRKTVKGHYKYFVFNLALVDLIYSISHLVEAILFFDIRYGGFFCMLHGFVFWYGFAAMGFSLVPVLVHRYIVFYKPDAYVRHVFKPRNIVLMCMLADLFPVLETLPLGTFLGTFGRSKESWVCTFMPINLVTAHYSMWYAVFMSGCSVTVSGVILCVGLKIYQKMCLKLKLDIAMKEKKDIEKSKRRVYVTLIQAIFPIIGTVPFIFLNTIKSLYIGREEDKKITETLRIPIFRFFYYFSLALYLFKPVANACVTLKMLTQYRKALHEMGKMIQLRLTGRVTPVQNI